MPIIGGGSLFQVKDFQERGGSETLNVYFYFSSDPPDTIPVDEFADVWEPIIDAWLPPIQTTNVSHTVIEVEELTSVSNFLTRPSSIGDGEKVTAPLSNFLAASIRLLRTTKETRSGWKRYLAGTETDMSTNIWEAAFQAQLDNLAGVLNDPVITVSGTAEPVIVRKTRDEGTGDLNPPTLWIYNLIASAESKTFITTQNSRKL